MSWRSDVISVIGEHWRTGEEFAIDSLYRFEDELASRHPENHNVRAKIRQTVAVLRRDRLLGSCRRHATYVRLFPAPAQSRPRAIEVPA
jgi:hypothetical protein